MQEVAISQSRQRDSPPTSWPTGVMEMGVLSFTERLRRLQAFDRCLVDEAAEPKIEEGAQLDKLVHAHLALPVQDVPEPLPVHTDTTSELSRAYSLRPPRMLDKPDCDFIYIILL